ncbi:hypothetical protein IKQ26_04815 [bacterium]|nr:hypothetical protein [bacterium]
MKKIILAGVVLSLFLTTTVFATEMYDRKLDVLKNSKNAKQKVVKGKIKMTKKEIKRTVENPNLSDKEKYRRIEMYQNRLAALEQQNKSIKKQYKRDKKVLKQKYN